MSAHVAQVDGRVKLSSGSHLMHELLITDFAVSVAEAARQRAGVQILWQERFGLVGDPAFRNLVPDFAFLFRSREGLLVCLLEVSSGEQSSVRIREKLQQYADWSTSSEGILFLTNRYRAHGAREPRPEFRLLFVVQNRLSGRDHIRLRQVFNEAMHFPNSMLPRTWGTTIADLSAAAGVDDPVWSCGSDLVPFIPRWSGARLQNRGRIIQTLLTRLPRHRLFACTEHLR